MTSTSDSKKNLPEYANFLNHYQNLLEHYEHSSKLIPVIQKYWIEQNYTDTESAFEEALQAHANATVVYEKAIKAYKKLIQKYLDGLI